MKKTISLLLAAALALGLGACSDNGDAAPTATAGTTDLASLTVARPDTSYSGTVLTIREHTLTLDTETDGEVEIPLSADTRILRAPPSGGDRPDGAAPPDGEPPEDGGSSRSEPALTWMDIAVGNTVTVRVGADGSAETVTLASGGNERPGGATGAPEDYFAVRTYTQDATVSGDRLVSTGMDENAVLLATAGVRVSLEDVTITRTSADSTGGDASSFYGVGAAALVTAGTLTITGSTIETDAAGGAGVFAYGEGTARVSDSTIRTEQDAAGGVHVAGGGTLYATNLIVETQGESSAAIRSDRGGGVLIVDGGSYSTSGSGSPAVYSTAEITIDNATLTASGSEAVCIEGANSVRLTDCTLRGNMADLPQNDCTWTVILYQSMSGDAEPGTSVFEMTGGSLYSENGGLFYTTNTASVFRLTGVEIECAADCAFLLRCTGNRNQRGWGSAGANGATCTFTACDQLLAGDVLWDSISSLDFYLTEGSTLTGAVLQDASSAGSGGDGHANVYIDANSHWVVTGDSRLSGLHCAGTIVDADGNRVSVVGADGHVYVSGTSAYVITVDQYSSVYAQ